MSPGKRHNQLELITFDSQQLVLQKHLLNSRNLNIWVLRSTSVQFPGKLQPFIDPCNFVKI